MSDEVAYRTAATADFPFISHSWVENYFYTSAWAKLMPMVIFMREQKRLIKYLLAKRSMNGVVAVLKDEPNVLLGFTIYEHDPDTIHYVYVKSAFRRHGIAKGMLNAAGLDLDNVYCSHWTYALAQFAPKYPKLKFNPYRLFPHNLEEEHGTSD